MSNQTIKFPFKEDLLFVRGEPISEIIYIHLNDTDGADFVAHFDSFQSDTPIVYELKKIEIPSYTAVSNDDYPTEMQINNNLTENQWQRMGMINTIFPGSWNQVFCIVRNEIIRKNKE